jgi:predicted nucleotidyltransferase component of viral defense system
LPSIVEKDYVLGWILAGINAHDELGENWVFKGGTCLKKCYFETYRFSEDLDFTLRNEEHLDEEFLRTAFEEVISWMTVFIPVQSQAWILAALYGGFIFLSSTYWLPSRADRPRAK